MFRTRSRGAGVWLITGAFFLVMLGVALPTPLYPIYEHRFGLAPVMITVIFSVYVIGTITGLLLCGHLSDRIGRRHVLLPGVAFSALSAVTFLLAQGLPELLLGRVLSGLSAGIFSSVAPAAIVDLVPQAERGKATTIGIGGDLLGLAFGPLTAGVLAESFPFPLHIPFAADLVLLIPAAVALLLVPETVKSTHEGFRLHVQPLRIPQAIRTTFIRATIAGMCGFAIAGLFSAVVPSFLATVLHHQNHALAGSLVFVFLGFAAMGQLGVGRFSKRNALPSACVLLVAGLGLLASGVVWRSLTLFFCSAVVSGLGDGLAIGFGLSQINQNVSERRGEINATYFVLLYIGMSSSTVGVGLLASATGLPLASLIFCGLVGSTVVGVLIALLVGAAKE